MKCSRCGEGALKPVVFLESLKSVSWEEGERPIKRRSAVSDKEEIQRFIELEQALDIQQKQMMKIFMPRVEKALREET